MEATVRPVHPPSKGGPYIVYVYQNKTAYIENLASLKNVADLVGQEIVVSVPYRLFSYEQSKRVRYVLEFYIRGEKIKVQADERGMVEGPITKEMFGGVSSF
ncbi:MAG: hypothetical protein QOF14_4110 [Hyphomicrobiales bacterium]|nr:hypothetical protein [Hyphomicrobiales bacterium]